jgi:hypothetical protein
MGKKKNDDFDDDVMEILRQFNAGEDILDNLDANDTPVEEQLNEAILGAESCLETHQDMLNQLKALREKRAVQRGNPKCSICGEVQIETNSGPVCKNGHGGAPPADEPPEAVDVIQSCRYVDYSDITERVFSECDDFDGAEFEDQLSNHVTWGNANRTLVCLRDFCDSIRAMDCLTSEQADEIVEKVAKLVPYDVYIDMEN